ncbi:MAG: hypothetical protein Kow0063_43110 [Anaerolineae bacterium]
MSELLSTMRGALTLNIPTLLRFRERGDMFRRGLTILVLVGLIVGAVDFAVGFIGSLFAPPVEVQLAEISQSFDQMLQFMPPEAAEFFEEQVLVNIQAGFEMGREIAALPTPLPKVVGNLFEALGAWLTRPLTMLGGFLAYGIWVMLAAKLLGGTGRLQEFLGTASLSSIPYLLLVLSWIPCLGSVAGLVAWVWGAIIWVAATAVTHGWVTPVMAGENVVERYQVDWGKAILAVILPALALVVLVVIALLILGVIIALVASGSG